MTILGDWVDWFLRREISHSQLLWEKKNLLISIEDEKNRVKALQNDVTNLSRGQMKYTDEMEILKNELQEKKLEIQKFRKEYDMLEERHESTERALSDNVLKLNSVQNELVQMRLSHQNLVSRKDIVDKSLNEKELEYNTLVEEQKTLKKKCETFETRQKI